MDVYLKPLAAGVLALVGLLVIIALFVTHPTWLVPTVVTMAGINLAILLAVARVVKTDTGGSGLLVH